MLPGEIGEVGNAQAGRRQKGWQERADAARSSLRTLVLLQRKG
jgi:hypothetical protein